MPEIVLRPQQVVFEDAIRQAFRTHRRVLAAASTGFGKGVVIADMAGKAVAKGRNTLVVTNRRIIVKQLQEHAEKAGVHCGIIMGSEERDYEAPLQVASVQTLKRRDYRMIHEDPGFIIIDEAHQMHEEYRRMLSERYPTVPALGLTATPVGPGGARIGHFDVIVEPIKNSEIISQGDLLKVHPYVAPSEPDLGGINLKSASANEIGERVEACTVYGHVFEEWEPYQHMQTMVVLPNRAVCQGFYQQAIAKGISTKIVDGTTEQSERDDTFSEFKETDCQMLLGVDVIREGLDLPVAQCLIDLQPTHQFRVYWQKIGRVKRPHAGQDSAVVIDFAGNLWRHMVHPDHDPPWDEISTGKTIEEIIERKAGTRCPECGSKDIYGPIEGRYHCEECRHIWDTRKPWVCPHCKQALAPYQKCVGGICPNCGKKSSGKQVRRVRFADGELRSIPADEIKRRKKKHSDSAQQEWMKWLYIAKGWNAKNRSQNPKALSWCLAMYKRDHDEYPPPHVKFVPGTPAERKLPPERAYPFLFKKG